MVARAEPEITAKVETVTPDVARKWLSTLPAEGQRKPMKTHVDFIAEQIAAGRWGLNGQGIILTASEGLLDGQHRCSAIVKAGKAVRTLVVRGVEPIQFATIDTGVPRVATSVLSIRGRPNVTNLAVALRALANYRDEAWSGSRGRVTNQRILDLDEANPDMPEDVAWSMKAYHAMRARHLWKTGAAAFARSVMCAFDDEKAGRFCDALVDLGAKKAAHGWPASAAQALRERLRRAYDKRERLSVQEAVASFALAWNASGPVGWQDLVWIRPKPGQKDAAPMPRFKAR